MAVRRSVRKSSPARGARKAARPKASKAPRPARKASGAPELYVTFESLEVRRNGWPGGGGRPTDLSLVLQVEDPGGAGENRVLATDRLPLRAASGETIAFSQLAPGANGHPFFGGPVAVSDHVNLHVRLFVERTNAVGPILGAALNTVFGEMTRRIPLLPEPVREALHIQIGKTIATELARATVIVPVAEEAAAAAKHPVTVALVSPRSIPGFYAPPGSPAGYAQGVVATEGELAALLHLTLEVRPAS